MEATRERTSQLPLLDLSPMSPVRRRGATIQERFESFHATNPHVYQNLKRLSLQLKRRGNRRGSIGMLFEILRHQYMMQTSGDDYKLNNNFRSRYARLLQAQEPELRGFFETRELRS
jgi:hypothetical protein